MIIDHFKNINASGNEQYTLQNLHIGLLTIASNVAALEGPHREWEYCNSKRRAFYNADPENPLLPSYFHWFGVSLCNYMRLVGFLDGISTDSFSRKDLENPDEKKIKFIKEHCVTYIESISELSAIKIWRNKVFAHFAITDPKPDDNIALLEATIMQPVGFENSRFRVGTIIFDKSTGDKRRDSSELPSWSITETYEQLTQRFWPEASLPDIIYSRPTNSIE